MELSGEAMVFVCCESATKLLERFISGLRGVNKV